MKRPDLSLNSLTFLILATMKRDDRIGLCLVDDPSFCEKVTQHADKFRTPRFQYPRVEHAHVVDRANLTKQIVERVDIVRDLHNITIKKDRLIQKLSHTSWVYYQLSVMDIEYLIYYRTGRESEFLDFIVSLFAKLNPMTFWHHLIAHRLAIFMVNLISGH